MPMSAHEEDFCVGCGETISYTPPSGGRWVICNVYEPCTPCVTAVKKGQTVKDCRRCQGRMTRWDRLEHWHTTCYDEAGEPYGKAPYRKPVISKATSW